MAKKVTKESKSDKIRTELKAGGTPTEIAAKLKVSPALVYNVKGRLNGNGTAKKRGPKGALLSSKKTGRPGKTMGGKSTFIRNLIEAKRFIGNVGSVDAAREALEVVAKLG